VAGLVSGQLGSVGMYDRLQKSPCRPQMSSLPSYPGSSPPGRIEAVLGVAVLTGGRHCLAAYCHENKKMRPKKLAGGCT
jgi:hypothetical protein